MILRNATRLTCLKLLLSLFLLTTHHHTRIMFILSPPNTLPPVCCNSQVLTPILLGKIEFTRYFHPSFTWYNSGLKTSIILLPLQPSGVIDARLEPPKLGWEKIIIVDFVNWMGVGWLLSPWQVLKTLEVKVPLASHSIIMIRRTRGSGTATNIYPKGGKYVLIHKVKQNNHTCYTFSCCGTCYCIAQNTCSLYAEKLVVS